MAATSVFEHPSLNASVAFDSDVTAFNDSEFQNESRFYSAMSSSSSVNSLPTYLNCTLFGDDEQWKCHALLVIRRISATLSLIGCLWIIFVIWLFRRYQYFSQRLIVNLSISGILVSIGYWMGGLYQDGSRCNFEAFCLSLCDWSMLLWISFLTFNIFMNAVLVRTTERYECTYHVIGWSVPFIISIVPLFGDYYGPSGAWCWISQDNMQWRIGMWYAPFVVIVLLQCLAIVIVTVATKRRIKRWEGTYNPELERAKQTIKEEVKPLSGYPLVYLFTSCMSLFNKMHDVAHPGYPVFAFCILDSLMTPLSGFLNAVVFGMDRDTRARLTWMQIKANFFSHINPRPIIREISICDTQECFSDCQEIISDS